MRTVLLDLFPVFVGLSVLVVGYLGYRLNRHLGAAAYSAGPLDVTRPDPPGQEQTPWELHAIDDQLKIVDSRDSGLVRRYDLASTINRLSTSAGLVAPEYQVAVTAPRHEIEQAVTRIELQLGLPPLEGNADR